MSSVQVPPTRMALTTFKAKRVAAKKGFELLKKKADALKMRFQAMLREIQKTKMALSNQASEAFFSLTQAQYAAGDFRHKVIESVTNSTDIRLTNRIDNVAGVRLPVFTEIMTIGGLPTASSSAGSSSSGTSVSTNNIGTENIGLTGGGGKIMICREKFRNLIRACIKLASLQTSFITLDEALKVTNRRVNALDNVTIPKIESIISYILRELDELEREDFVRIKKVQANKIMFEKQETLKRANNPDASSSSVTSNDYDILSSYEPSNDDDVIF